jgi:hypothetical protein
MRLRFFAADRQANHRSARQRRKWLPRLEILEDRNAPDNLAPLATNDFYSLDEDTTLNVNMPGVLGNDSDPDNDPLTAVLVQGPSSGQLTFNADGSFIYAPDQDFNGQVTFTYKAFDGTDYSELATVTLTVNPVNDAPVALDDNLTTDMNIPITFAPLQNDFDVDGDSLNIVAYTAPSHGTVTLNQDQSFTYTPDTGQSADDNFTYTISDPSGATSMATVNITVGPAFNDYATTDEDTPVTIDVLANDDVSGTPLVLGASGAQHGSVVVNPDKTVTYTPDADWIGQDKFQYTMENGQGVTDTAAVTVTVTWVNDAPVAADDFESTGEGTSVTIHPLANDSDIDGDVIRIISQEQPEHGIAVYKDDGSIVYTPNSDWNSLDADGNATITDDFTYEIWDGYDGHDTATISITVTPENDVPITYNDAFAYGKPAGIVMTFHEPAAGILRNDIDYDLFDLNYDPATLQVASVDTTGLIGALAWHSDGSFDYTPPPNWFGVTTFSYVATDGIVTSNPSTAWLFVKEMEPIPCDVNDPEHCPPPPPLAAYPDEYLIHEDGFAGNVLANDVGANLAILVTPPAHARLEYFNADGSYLYKPLPDTAADGSGILDKNNPYGWSINLIYEAWSQDGRKAPADMPAIGPIVEMDARSHDFENPKTAGVWKYAKTYPRAAKKAPIVPTTYVHFNVDNDNLNTTDGKKPGDMGYDDTKPSVADYTEVAFVKDENDLKELKLRLTGHPVPRIGTVTLKRSNEKLRVWRYATKGLEGQDIAGAKVLVEADEKVWDLSNNASRDDFLAVSGGSLWVEGYGSAKEGTASLTLTWDSGLPSVHPGGGTLKYTAEVKYHFFAAVAGRQPTPKERKDLGDAFSKLVHGEWSVLGNETPVYNCIAWTVGEQNVNYWRLIHQPPGVIGIDRIFGNNNGIWEDFDIDEFYRKKTGWRNIQGADVSAPKAAEAMYYPGFHAARNRKELLADGQLIMYSSKVGQGPLIEHVWNQLNDSIYGNPRRYYK